MYVRKLFEVKDETYYTIKDLTAGFVVSRSSVFEMMNKGLKYSRFGGASFMRKANSRSIVLFKTGVFIRLCKYLAYLETQIFK